MYDGVKFRKELGSEGGILGISLPGELLEILDAKDQDVIVLQPKDGKFGKYLAAWVEKEVDVKDEQTTGIYKKD